MQKVVAERKTTKSSLAMSVKNFTCNDMKDSEKIESETEEERLSGSKDCDSALDSGIKINDTSNLGKQADQAQSGKMVLNNSEVKKSSDTKEKEFRILNIMNGEVSDITIGQVQEERMIAGIAQFTSMEVGKIPSSKWRRSFGTEQDEHHSSHRELNSVVNGVKAEVNLQKNTVERKPHFHIFSESAHHTGLKPLISDESVTPSQQTEETSGASNKSSGDVEKICDFLDLDEGVPGESKSRGISAEDSQWPTKRNCTNNGQETKRNSLKELSHCRNSKNAEKSTHTVKRSHTVSSKEVNSYSVKECIKSKYSSVLHGKFGHLKENMSVQKGTVGGSEIDNDKTRVTEVVETAAGQPLGESKPAENSQILGKLSWQLHAYSVQ
jgi:hypothetical protein